MTALRALSLTSCLLSACAARLAPPPIPLAAAPVGADRFVVANSVDRLADGTLTNCRLTDAPSDGACGVWQGGDEGPALFARTERPGEALRLSLIVDVRPWTGRLQPLAVPGQVEQVVLLGGEDQEACALLGRGGPVMEAWGEITACPLSDNPTSFFATLGDPRPRQSTWTLAAMPLSD